MKRIFTKFGLVAAVLGVFACSAMAQDNKPTDQPQDPQRAENNRPPDARSNMLRQLGLSREQMQELRRINKERKPTMQEAQSRLRLATRSLDESIYADQVNEADVQARLKEMQSAQAEVVKNRTMNELAVRRILTPDQLVRFREMRQRFEQVRVNADRGGRVDGGQPASAGNQFKESKQPVKPSMRPAQRPEL